MGQLLSCMNTRIREPVLYQIPIHHKCRNCGVKCDHSSSINTCIHAKYTRTDFIIRTVVPDDNHPIEFTSEKILTSTKEYVDLRSYHGIYKIIGSVPQNPCGRTGITGRGHLGHFGPNHAADPIVTRWKRNEHGAKILHRYTQQPILQFVCIRRKDTNEYAIPGGMMERQEKVTDTLQREFHEEALNFPDSDRYAKHQLLSTIKDIFENGGIKIYCGYVDDPRNTDNSWMETTAYNFHDENDEHLALLNVQAGSDAINACWQDLGSQTPLFASHTDFLRRVAYLHKAHW